MAVCISAFEDILWWLGVDKQSGMHFCSPPPSPEKKKKESRPPDWLLF